MKHNPQPFIPVSLTSVSMRGLTLIELLIAISIFAIISVVTFEGLQLAYQTQERMQQARERQAAIAMALEIISDDLMQIAPRAVRDTSGSLQPAYIYNQTSGGGDNARPYPLIFTRAGIPQIGLAYEHGLQRVAYDYETATRQLRRIVWPVLDTGKGQTPKIYPVLSGVLSMELRHLDSQRKEYANWPPSVSFMRSSDQDNRINAFTYLPYAIKLQLELEDLGKIERIMPGVSVPYDPEPSSGQQS